MNEAFFIPEAFFKAENKVMYGRVVVLEWDEEYTYMYSCSSCGMFCIVSVVIPQNNEMLKLKISLGFILVVVDDNRISTICWGNTNCYRQAQP